MRSLVVDEREMWWHKFRTLNRKCSNVNVLKAESTFRKEFGKVLCYMLRFLKHMSFLFNLQKLKLA